MKRNGTLHFLLILLLLFSGRVTPQPLDGIYTLKQRQDTAYINQMLAEAQHFVNLDLPDSSAPIFNDAFDASKRINYHYGICRSFVGLSYSKYKDGDYTEALRLLNLASKYNIGSEKWNIRMHLNIEGEQSVICNLMGQYQEAMRHYFNQLIFLKETTAGRQFVFGIPNKSHIGSLYSNIGQLFITVDNIPKAQYYLFLAEQEARTHNDSILLARIFINMGMLIFSRDANLEGWPQQSIDYTLKALNITRRYQLWGAAPSRINALCNLAVFEMSKTYPDYEVAMAYLKEALEIPGIETSAKFYILINMGAYYVEKRELSNARKVLNEALTLAEATRSKELRAHAYAALADYNKQKKDYKKAMHYFEMYINTKDSLKSNNISEKVHQIQYQYDAARKDNELIRRQLQIQHQQAIIQRKNMLAGTLVAGGILLGGFSWIYSRHRRKLQMREDRRNMEVAAWRASLEGEEKERKRLAHQLHDHIGGNLATVKMWFGNIRSRLNGRLGALEKAYRDALQLLDNTLMEVRNTAHHLMPELLLRLGLAEAIRVFCANMQKASGIHIRYHYFGYIGALDKNLELIIYRTVQELVQNVTKHAQASQALVQLSQHEDLLSITVEDNGIGMNTEEQEENNGIGLQSILNSIEKLGGEFRVQSEPGNGTTVDIEIRTKKTIPAKNETTI